MTKLGKFIFTLVILGIAAFAFFQWLPDADPPTASPGAPGGSSSDPADPADPADAGAPAGDPLDSDVFIAVPDQPERLPGAQTYQMDGDTLVIELSEYAGYAGLIVANGGLEPNADSFFAQTYGFQVRLTLSEEDSWAALQRGEMAASATTVDVLACIGRQFQAVVPAQIAFSRGADGIIVRKEIRRINDLKGKIVAAAPFNETEFFIRYLAQEANLPVKRLASPAEQTDPEAVNLVFAEDAFQAADAFLADLESGGDTIAGCVTWAPKTTEVVEASNGRARQLVDNKNLLIISDILIFNKGFADAEPEKVKGIVHGLLHGNDLVRNNPGQHAAAIADAFKEFEWTAEDATEELSKIHLSNLPENLAFFSGATDASGSFESIYGSAVLAYGSKTVPNPAPAGHFVDTSALEALQAENHFAGQEIAIRPVRSSDRSPIESDPLLSKDIRFLFEPNSAQLDMAEPANTEYLTTIRKMLQVSPGSIVLLRGHVDDSLVPEFREQGGEAFVRTMALKAMELSKQRAEEIQSQLLAMFPTLTPERIEMIGRGWEEPLGPDPDPNRRVEVQWFTVE
ncbi:hypothetical protein BH23VER1_BH23VER1_17040 [soil metagenome]